MPTIGLDVGGTKVLGIVLDDAGAIVAEHKEATPRDSEGLLEHLVAVARALRDDQPGVTALGVGVPGLVDRRGTLRFAPNLPGVVELPVGPRLSAALGLPVRADNDATCAAWAEHQLGAAAGADTALLVTLGTGIGGGLVVDGLLVRGANGFAGEVGHMVVDPSGPLCTCGKRGCWERFASGSGLARLAREAAHAGRLSSVVHLAGDDPEAVRGEHVAVAAAGGDAEAQTVLDELGRWIAVGLSNLVLVLDPEVIVVGGGLVDSLALVLDTVRRSVASMLEPGGSRPEVRIVPAALGEQAGAIGAALVARQDDRYGAGLARRRVASG